jgi:hypothetical protein
MLARASSQAIGAVPEVQRFGLLSGRGVAQGSFPSAGPAERPVTGAVPWIKSRRSGQPLRYTRLVCRLQLVFALPAAACLFLAGCGTTASRTANSTRTTDFRMLGSYQGLYVVERWPANGRLISVPHATVSSHAYGTPMCSLARRSTDLSYVVRAQRRTSHKYARILALARVCGAFARLARRHPGAVFRLIRDGR